MALSRDFLNYNATDSACTLEARNSFWDDLKEGFEQTYHMTDRLLPLLMFMQSRGIKVDFEALNKTKGEIIASAATKQVELNALCGRELNVNSPKDCQAYFYIELGIPPYFKEGRVTVDDTALQRLTRGTAKRSGLRQAKLVQEIRGLQKLHSTYLGLEFDSDGRFRSSYNPRGTKFGRLSSSKTIFETGGNAQNLPPEFKKFLVSDGIFLEFDKRQAEWVVVAYLSGDANMIKVIEEGRDTHIHTASLMFAIPHVIMEKESKLVGYNTDPDLIQELRAQDEDVARYATQLPRTLSGRQMGKKSNHGLNYDEGPGQFALINELELSEGKKAVELYHLIYPGIRGNYYTSVQRQLGQTRTLTNCLGRKVRFMDQWGNDLFKSAYSMQPQSTVFDSLMQGIVDIYDNEEFTSPGGMNLDLLAQVHDSVLTQLPWDKVTDTHAVQRLCEIICDKVSPELSYNGRMFKIATDIKIGLNWGSYHKDMNPNGMQEVTLAQLPAMLEKLREQRTR